VKEDPTAEQRKKDHIELALASQVSHADERFYYEPIMASHQDGKDKLPHSFLNKSLQLPLWVSSMTGGTQWAKVINQNLAKACNEFGMGMGLGSCRALLYDDTHLKDFQVRSLIGDQPLFTNLGIAQLERIANEKSWDKVSELIKKLEADGLIVHVNPFQEISQPEGDLIQRSPLETISALLENIDAPIIVKEVGQGMGYRSLEALLKLPLAAVDFAAHGGTNFTKIELARSENPDNLSPLTTVGHSAEEMLKLCNQLVDDLGEKVECKELIISGGVRDFLDGYYLIENSKLSAIYGQAGAFLKHARGEYEELQKYVASQQKGLEMAYAYLTIKKPI